MTGELIVKIKRQPHNPPFVLRINGEDLRARIGRLDNDSVVAKIKGLGTYRIDVNDVGFWFVEKKAEPWNHGRGRLPDEVRGGVLERMWTSGVRSLGHHCGSVVSEIRDALFRSGG